MSELAKRVASALVLAPVAIAAVYLGDAVLAFQSRDRRFGRVSA